MARRPSRILAVVLAVPVFVMALGAGAALHLALPPARLALTTWLEALLNQSFRGKLSLGTLAQVDPLALGLRDASVHDPSGRLVLALPVVRANLDLLGTGFGVVQALVRGEPMKIHIDALELETPELYLYDGESAGSEGEAVLSLVETFEPRAAPDPRANPDSSLRFSLGRFSVTDLHGESELGAIPSGEFRASADGSLDWSEAGLKLDLATISAEVRGPLEDPVQLRGQYHLMPEGAMAALVELDVGDATASEEISYDSGIVSVKGAVDELTPDLMRKVWSDWPLDQAVDVVHEVSGLLPRLQVNAEVRARGGEVKLAGRLRVSPEIEADLDVDANELDLSTLRSDLPRSRFGLRSALEVWGAEGRPVLNWNATVLPGEIAGTPNPAVDVAGSYDERGLLGTATVHERGLPLHVSFEQGDREHLSFEALLKRTRLEQAPRIQSLLNVQGELEGTVRGTWNGERLVMRPAISGDRVRYGNIAVTRFALNGQAEGRPDMLEDVAVDLTLSAEEAKLGPVVLEKVKVGARGALQDPLLVLDAHSRRGYDLHLAARTRTDRVDVRELRGEIRGEGKPIALRANRVQSDGSVFELAGLVVESTGRLEADAKLTRDTASYRVSGHSLDLSRIARILELPPGTLDGKLDMEGQGELGVQSQARLRLVVHDGGFQGVVGTDVDLSGEIAGQALTLGSRLSVEGLGRLDVEGQVDLGGSPLASTVFERSSGKVRVDVRDLALATLSELVRSPSAVLEGGRAQVKMELTKEAGALLPLTHFEVTTEGLLVRAFDGSLRTSGIDVQGIGDLEPERDRLAATLRLDDFMGELCSSSAELTLPLAEWSERLPSLEELASRLRGAPLSAVLAVPRRDIRDLPPPLTNFLGLDGTLEARASARGTPSTPVIDASAMLGELRGQNTSLTAPVALDLRVRYEPVAELVSGQILGRSRDAQVATGTFQLRFPQEQGAGPRWTGEAQLLLDEAPLELFEPLKNQEIEGKLQGAVSIHRDREGLNLQGDLRVNRFSIAEQPLGTAQLRATTEGNELRIDAEFDDEFGSLRASLRGQTTPTPWALAITRGAPFALSVEAHRYDAAVLGPAFEGVLSDLSGALDGQLRAEIRLPEAPDEPIGASFQGQMRLTSGSMVPASMGLKLEDVDLNIKAGPAGDYTVVELTDIRARARADVHNLKGKGVLYFRGLELTEGQLNLSQNQVPILSEGVKLADLTGQLSIGLKRNDKELSVDLKVPELDAVLPATSDRSLIELKENETISVLGPARPQKFERPREEDALPIVVRVHLGSRVRVKSSFASIRIEGDPVVRVDEELTVKGQVRLAQGGRIEVLGRVFIIDHGTVYFDDEEMTNPLIDTTATWRAPSGVLVRATLSGRAKNPSLEWTSDPPLPGGESAIIALVLGAGSSGRASSDGIAYGAAAINQILGESGVRGVEITAGQESQSAGQAARLSDRTWNSYAAAVQISDEVWFEGKWTQESRTTTTNSRNGFSGTIDWRFDPSWSLRTEVGNLGLGVDLLWQYRY